MGTDHMTDINIFLKANYNKTYEIKLIYQFACYNLSILYKNLTFLHQGKFILNSS